MHLMSSITGKGSQTCACTLEYRLKTVEHFATYFMKISQIIRKSKRLENSDILIFLTSLSTIVQSWWDGATASMVFTSTFGSLKCLA